MDTTNDPRPPVALPGICATVRLPQLPNFLQPVTGGNSIPIGDLKQQDVVALGLALQRALVAHWSERFASRHQLSEREAEEIGAELVHPAIVERLARAEAARQGCHWMGLAPEDRTARCARIAATLNEFAQELTRYG